MNGRRYWRALIAIAALSAGAPHAQSGGDFAIVKSTIDAGGGTAAAGPYVLNATIGQADAHYSEGGAFSLRGGFWGAAGNSAGDRIFQNGFD